MYEVLINDKTLYYPASAEYTIYGATLDLEVGLAGEFEFNIPPTNPMYSQIGQGAVITILRDNTEFWRGEVKETNVDINKVMNVYCLEDLAWLADEFMFPSSITNETYAQRFSAAIGAYNTDRGADRQFTVGYITNVTSSDMCNWYTEYDWSILESLRTCIAGDDGYLRVRRETVGGVVTRYIDIVKLSDYGSLSTQSIRFGVNLIDYLEEMNLDNFTNDLYPYGAETETQIYEDYNQRLAGTHIQNAVSIGAFGKHSKAVVFETDDLTTLNNLASAYLTRYSQPQLTLKIDALDLAEISVNAHFEIGDAIPVIAEPFAIDQNLYLTQQTIDLLDVSKNKVTLSSYITRGSTLTSQNNAAADAIKKIPSKSSILDAAKRNAYEILTGENGGYVTFETNSDGQITELRIANNLDFDRATKCWRWNLNGLAYLQRDVYTDPWSVEVAATMDGGIVANFITTGELIANNGVYELNMASGKVTMQDGDFTGKITSSTGAIGGFEITSDALGDKIGTSQCVGMKHADKLFTWHPSGKINIGFGTLDIYGTGGSVADGIHIYSSMSGGDEMAIDHSTVWCDDHGSVVWSGSDEKLKKNIKDLSLEDALYLINNVRPRVFEFKKEAGKRYGFIAQEVRSILNDDSGIEFASGNDVRNINYIDFIAPLCMVVKDLQSQLAELKAEIKSMKGEKNG